MKIALFLGAGASKPFEKPTTVELRDKLVEKYRGSLQPKFLSSFLYCNKFQDIEHVFQSIRDIRIFVNSYGNMFFTNMGFGLFFHRGDEEIRLSDFVNEADKTEKILENEVFVNYAWDHSKDFELSRVYDTIFSILKKESDEIRIFTTNYDRAIEQYCNLETNPYRCIDGFKLDNSERFLWTNGDFAYFDNDTKENNIYLYKLHGSLNWKMHSKYKLERTPEEQKSSDPNYKASILVYPTMSPKDGHELEPFKTIRKNFITYMKNADACIVIGFSFRDLHINDIFQEFINSKKPLVTISPHSVENICTNFLNEEVPDYQGKTTVMPSRKYDNIWCVQLGISQINAGTPLDLAISLIKSVIEKSKVK